ncbi:hypothetical protein NE237_031601 [Protea cynaroides]|uniref:Uncharacterized protein n=1 Tax=Protea cynaroides TaxID=273540 RepID=A0A9Q0L1T2_9MAGN|nr:hypothetical protein NE237_031601 [Protea cynaroides]
MEGKKKNEIRIGVGTGGDEGERERERERESLEELRLERGTEGDPPWNLTKLSWLSTFLWLLRSLLNGILGQQLAVSEENTLPHISCSQPSSPYICLNEDICLNEELTSTTYTMDLAL